MKYQLKQKAYEINLNKIEEGYLYSEIICYAESIGKAKSELLDRNRYENCKLKYSDDEITYLTIPVVRCKAADKYDFEGKDLTKYEIQSTLNDRERISLLDDILKDENISHCYIKKGSYYRPGACGYTDMRHRAGVFTKKEAVSCAKSCSDLTLISIDIEEHNSMIKKEIDDLKTRVLETVL